MKAIKYIKGILLQRKLRRVLVKADYFIKIGFCDELRMDRDGVSFYKNGKEVRVEKP